MVFLDNAVEKEYVHLLSSYYLTMEGGPLNRRASIYGLVHYLHTHKQEYEQLYKHLAPDRAEQLATSLSRMVPYGKLVDAVFQSPEPESELRVFFCNVPDVHLREVAQRLRPEHAPRQEDVLRRVEETYLIRIHDKFPAVVFCLARTTSDNRLTLLIGVPSRVMNTQEQLLAVLEQCFCPMESITERLRPITAWDLRPDPASDVPWAAALHVINSFVTLRSLNGTICAGIKRDPLAGYLDVGDANMNALVVYASMASANMGRTMSVFRAKEREQLGQYWTYPALAESFAGERACESDRCLFNASTQEARAWTFHLWDKDCGDVTASQWLRRRLTLAGTPCGMSFFEVVADPVNRQWRFLVVLRFCAGARFLREALSRALEPRLRIGLMALGTCTPVDLLSNHSLILPIFMAPMYKRDGSITTANYDAFRRTLRRAADMCSQAQGLCLFTGQPLQALSRVRRSVEERARLVLVLMPPAVVFPNTRTAFFGDMPCVRRLGAGDRAMAAYIPNWPEAGGAGAARQALSVPEPAGAADETEDEDEEEDSAGGAGGRGREDESRDDAFDTRLLDGFSDDDGSPSGGGGGGGGAAAAEAAGAGAAAEAVAVGAEGGAGAAAAGAEGGAGAAIDMDRWLDREELRAEQVQKYQDMALEKMKTAREMKSKMDEVRSQMEQELKRARNMGDSRAEAAVGQKRAREEEEVSAAAVVEEALQMVKEVRALLAGIQAQMKVALNTLAKGMRPMYHVLDPQMVALATGVIEIQCHLERRRTQYTKDKEALLKDVWSRLKRVAGDDVVPQGEPALHKFIGHDLLQTRLDVFEKALELESLALETGLVESDFGELPRYVQEIRVALSFVRKVMRRTDEDQQDRRRRDGDGGAGQA